MSARAMAIAFSVAVFAAAGLLGPLVQWLTWPPSQGGVAGSPHMYWFITMLWPMRLMFGLADAGNHSYWLAVDVASNAMLFSAFGLIAGVLPRAPIYIRVQAFATVCLVVLFGLFIGGFQARFVHWLSVTLACIVYVMPFIAVALFRRRIEAGRLQPRSSGPAGPSGRQLLSSANGQDGGSSAH